MPDIRIQSNKIFATVHKSKHRYVIMKGSAGSGKSVDTAQQYILRLLTDRGRNLICVRKIEQSNRNSTFAELTGAINRLGLSSYFTSTVSPLNIKCRNGNEIIFCGLYDDRQREKLKSVTFSNGKLTDVWIEEATELLQQDFEIIDDRLRGELPDNLFYQIKMTFNPVSAQHWIKRYFFDRQDKNVLTHHSTYLDNKWCDEAFKERMERRKTLDPEGYLIYGLGEWGETEGVIFKNWEEKELEQDLLKYDDTAIGQDFGFNHANAILLLGIKDNEIYVLKELYEYEKDTSELIELAEGGFPKNIVMFCDAAEPDRIQMWRRAGYRAIECKKNPGSVKAQIDWLQQRKIYIDSSCVNTLAEIGQWRWKQDRISGEYTDEPVNIFDDAMAALRYGVQNWRLRGGVEVKEPDTRTDLQKYRDKVLKRAGKKGRSYF